MLRAAVVTAAVGFAALQVRCPQPEPYDCERPPAQRGLVRVADAIPGQYIVVFDPATPMVAVRAARPGVIGVRAYAQVLNGYSATVDAPGLVALLADRRVLYVQQDGRKSTRVEWGLDRVDQRDLPLDGRYDPGTAGAGVHVAVVDTGVTAHPDFAERLSAECFSAFGDCRDGHGHGTHVAGTAAGTRYGVAKGATLHAVRVLDANGSSSDSAVIAGLDWVVDRKQANPERPWVANLSLGGSPSPALDQAICRTIDAGVTVVVAAGNESADACGASPARVVQALTLGASDRRDGRASFSNTGRCVDLHAPGVDVTSSRPGGGEQTFSGTSMASPHAAGGAALLLGLRPALKPAQVHEVAVRQATLGRLSSVPANTANLLLFVGPSETPPAPAPTPTPCPSPTPCPCGETGEVGPPPCPAPICAECPPPPPSPSPSPSPASPPSTPPPPARACPAFVRVGGGLHNCFDQFFQPIPGCQQRKEIPVGGGFVIDTTQRFAGCPRGCPCDEGHPCDGRTDCADPRGQAWSWEGPTANCQVANSPADDPTRGYQLNCKRFSEGGVFRWEACVPDDGRTGRGEPWKYAPDAERCVSGEVRVQ